MTDKGRTRPHFDLAAVAAEQHGVVSARQLESFGYARSTIADLAKAGRLHRIHRGVYAVGHTDLSWHGHCMAAVLARAPAVASHWSAAWLWGLPQRRPALFHLTAPSRRHRRRDF